MKALLIAEKPSLRKEIEAVYDKVKSKVPYDITFTEQRGHLVTTMLPDEISETMKSWTWDTIPFHPESFGGFRYKVIKEKKTGSFMTSQERFDHIKKEIRSGKYDVVINAGDPDQEGELLIRTSLAEIGNTLPMLRFWSNDLTPSAIEKALCNLKDDDNDPMLTNLYQAALLRQHSDYRFGINLTRAATLRFKTKAQIGRVKSPILAIVCRRELEILDFKPKTAYGVEAVYAEGFKGSLFNPKEAKDEEPADADEKGTEEKTGIIWFDTKEEAEALISMLGGSAEVRSVTRKRETTYAPKLFNLAALQTAAGKAGYTGEEVLAILQKLYEMKLLSYPRTSCSYLASGEDFEGILRGLLATEMEPYIKKITKSSIAKVRATKKWVNDAELEKAGHSALRPTTIVPGPGALSPREEFIYMMVVRRFVAIFLPPMLSDKTVVVADMDGKAFRSAGRTIVDPGYTEMYGTELKETVLPMVTEGQVLNVTEKNVTEKTTTCPRRYSDGELIAACENPLKYLEDEALKKLGRELKIGTPATRAGIIGELISPCGYMMRYRDGKVERIKPTELGMALFRNLDGMSITKVDMTGLWEEKLQLVRDGMLTYARVNDEMMKEVDRQVDEIRNKGDETVISVAGDKGRPKMFSEIAKCPLCGKSMLMGKKSYFCEGYKDGCQSHIVSTICGASIDEKTARALLEGKHVTKKFRKDDRNWDQEIYYDSAKCEIVFVKKDNTDRESEYKCMICGSSLIENAYLFRCPNCDKMRIWKAIGKEPNRYVLKENELKQLLTARSTPFIRLKSEKGPYEAKLMLTAEGVRMVFPERKGRGGKK